MASLQFLVFFLGVTLVICQQQNQLPFGPQFDAPFEPKPPSPGPCPVTPVVQNFNLHQYLGRWYEIERFFNPFQDGDCVTADYQLFPNGTVSVVNTQVLEGELDSVNGFANLGPNPTEGRLEVEFPFSESGGSKSDGEPNYIVVATDYHNYAVVYSCSYFGPDFKFEFSWILAREPKIPQSFLMELKDWLLKVNIDSSRYIPTFQDYKCPRRQV